MNQYNFSLSIKSPELKKDIINEANTLDHNEFESENKQ